MKWGYVVTIIVTLLAISTWFGSRGDKTPAEAQPDGANAQPEREEAVSRPVAPKNEPVRPDAPASLQPSASRSMHEVYRDCEKAQLDGKQPAATLWSCLETNRYTGRIDSAGCRGEMQNGKRVGRWECETSAESSSDAGRRTQVREYQEGKMVAAEVHDTASSVPEVLGKSDYKDGQVKRQEILGPDGVRAQALEFPGNNIMEQVIYCSDGMTEYRRITYKNYRPTPGPVTPCPDGVVPSEDFPSQIHGEATGKDVN